MHNSKDDHITRHVINKLASRGFGQSTFNGIHQQWAGDCYREVFNTRIRRQAAMKAIAGMTGIRRVVNQMTVKPAAKRT